MESRKRSIGRSLQFRLIIIFSTLGILAAFVASIWSYIVVQKETKRFIDEELSQIAAIVINYDMLIPKRWEGPRHLHERMFFSHSSIESRNFNGLELTRQKDIPRLSDLNKQNFDIIIAPLYGTAGDDIFIPPAVDDGFYNVLVSDKRIRVFVATKSNGRRFVVARPLTTVENFSSTAFYTSLTQFLSILILYIPTVIISVNLMFKAIYRIAKNIDKRKDDLSKLQGSDEGYIPSELDSFIDAINGLLLRVDKSVKSQKNFIANAAHEMRTPLTALSLQAEALFTENLSDTAKNKLKLLQQGIIRERELMTSLLTLAKCQDNKDLILDNISIKDIYIKLVEDLSSIAEDKDIDFGVEGNIDFNILSSSSDILCVMTNLISNALKYTKEGGRVDLMAEDNAENLTLIVKDTGSGIDEEQLEKVFDPFFRVDGDKQEVEGTGLGLAIAYAASKRINGRIVLTNYKDEENSGLLAKLIIKK